MVVNDSYLPFFETKKRYAVLLGGAGSGKSIAVVQKICARILTERGHRILCIRKVAATLRGSVFQTIQDQLSELGVLHEFKINKSEMRFTHDSGNEFILAGMDDPEKIKSIAGITSVWCEEATELTETDFNQLELRVRGETANYKQFVLSFNPIDEDHWLKKRFFDTKDIDVYTLKTTYKDNTFLDEEYKKHLLERLRTRENLYKVYVLGEWGRTTYGGEFLKCWKSGVHTGHYPHDPDQAIYLYFDENVNPYFPCGFFQVGKDQKTPRMIHCIAAKHPNNKINWMCREITRKLQEWGHKERLYIGGDATSQKEDVKLEEGDDMFRLIMRELAQFKPVRKTTNSNPSVRMSADFFNSILEGGVDKMSFGVDNLCRPAILDYQNTKEDKNGKVDKKTVVDEITKVTYQPYGHFCDLTRYFLCNTFSSEYEFYQRGSKPFSNVQTGDRKSKHGW